MECILHNLTSCSRLRECNAGELNKIWVVVDIMGQSTVPTDLFNKIQQSTWSCFGGKHKIPSGPNTPAAHNQGAIISLRVLYMLLSAVYDRIDSKPKQHVRDKPMKVIMFVGLSDGVQEAGS